MKIERNNIWLCIDCTFVACNGPHGGEFSQPLSSILNGLSKFKNLVPNFDSEDEQGIRTFSSVPCESCGTTLAGYRAQFATLTEDTKEEANNG